MDQQLMVRAELSVKYEEKEAARRLREWNSRLLPIERPKLKKGQKVPEHIDMKLDLALIPHE
jgi:hypothetical protein